MRLSTSPREVFDKRAVEKNQVVFHDVSYIEMKPYVSKNAVAVELTDFSVFYSQDTMDNGRRFPGCRKGARSWSRMGRSSK